MTKMDINEYLYNEFGLEGDEAHISDEWPFHLHFVGSLQWRGRLTEFYEFSDQETDYYAQEGFFFPKAGMTLDDLDLQDIGEQWISEQRPVDLHTSMIGDHQVPLVIERRHSIEALAKKALGENAVFTVVEGLFLRKTGAYFALLQVDTLDDAVVVGTEWKPIAVGFPEASSSRRLSYALGKFLADRNVLM